MGEDTEKRTNEELDDINKEILKILKTNARASFTDIGKELNISRVAVMKRVRKLEEAGIIRGYRTIIYCDGAVKMIMEIYTNTDDTEDIFEYLNRTGYVKEIYQLTGNLHFQAIAVAPDVSELKYLSLMFQKKFAAKIRKYETHAVKEIIKDEYGGVDYDRTERERNKRDE